MKEHSLTKSGTDELPGLIDNKTFKKTYNKVINKLNKLPLSNLDWLTIEKEFLSAGFIIKSNFLVCKGNLQINITSILNVLSFEKVVYQTHNQELHSTPKLSTHERLIYYLLNKLAPELCIVNSVLQHQERFANKNGLFRPLSTTHQIKNIN
ncbi:hypothetical protein [Mucilaginibacter sp. UYCu711]|uniref:hypothetical protein n=1 Tax=Mucilaginibacter sp. UYCu711 TaxID=3156339 RepID=UPI003D22C262